MSLRVLSVSAAALLLAACTVPVKVPEIPLRLYTIAASYWATGPPLP